MDHWSSRFGARLFRQNQLCPSDVAANLPNSRGVFQLATSCLKPKIELFLSKIYELGTQFVDTLGTKVRGLLARHRSSPKPYESPRRVMNRVSTGSFAAARAIAS